MTAAMSRSGGIRVTLIQWITVPAMPALRLPHRSPCLPDHHARAVVLALTACAQSPEAQKQKALERGETYLRKGQYNEAIIGVPERASGRSRVRSALHALGRAYEGRSGSSTRGAS